MDKEKALELITQQRAAIDVLKTSHVNSKEFKEWRENTRVIIKSVFGINSEYYKKFDALSFYPIVPFHTAKYKGEPSAEKVAQKYVADLESCDVMMNGMLTEISIQDDKDIDEGNTEHATGIVCKICTNFHKAAKQILKRHDGRSTLEINDEYDVQDLLHSFLKLHFNDIRPEEWTPSYAGSASRMDFLLKKEKIVIEVKKTRKNLGAKEIGEQLLIDIERYTAHPDCETLICFVYDPDELVANPHGIENDLYRDTDSLKVITIIVPK